MYVNTDILKSNFWARTECSRKENTFVSFKKLLLELASSHIFVYILYNKAVLV